MGADQAGRTVWRAATAGIADGIPAALPALARAQKVLRRLHRRGLDVPSLSPEAADPEAATPDEHREQILAVGAELLEAVRAAEAAGIDAEGALRQATAQVERATDA